LFLKKGTNIGFLKSYSVKLGDKTNKQAKKTIKRLQSPSFHIRADILNFLSSSFPPSLPPLLEPFCQSFLMFFFFFFAVLGLELRAFTLSHSTSPIFVKGFSREGFAELFAQAGFEPRSSWSLPPALLGLQAPRQKGILFILFFQQHWSLNSGLSCLLGWCS
jgi:hypothetical protein